MFVVWIIVIVFVLLMVGGMKQAADNPRPQAKYRGKKLSQVGDKTEGGLACPNCGSTSFQAKRSTGGKIAGGLLAPKTRVKCVACGVQFVRG